jgi:hypothetical protein
MLNHNDIYQVRKIRSANRYNIHLKFIQQDSELWYMCILMMIRYRIHIRKWILFGVHAANAVRIA